MAPKPYIPLGRIWRALELRDMLDAAGITSTCKENLGGGAATRLIPGTPHALS